MSQSIFEFEKSLKDFLSILKKAKKYKARLESYSFYAEKARVGLAALRKSFLKVQRDFPKERYAGVAYKLATIEPLVNKLVAIYPTSINEIIVLLSQIKFLSESDLAAEIESVDIIDKDSEVAFLPDDLFEERHRVLKMILWEANRDYANACYNSCATMIRRLIETLIIEAYQHYQLQHVILKSGEYLSLNELIGKTCNQREFNLSRETKRILPDLKFYGDIGAHNRDVIVRKPDLERLHNATRLAIEELYSKATS